MVTLAIGVVVLVLVLWLAGQVSNLNPKLLLQRATQAGGALALVSGIGLVATGRFMAGAPLIFFGLSMVGWLPQATGLLNRTRRTPGQVSRVRTALVEMELDHDTGTMRGTVVAGAMAGRALDTLSRADLLALLASADSQSASVLEAYLDRREPGWREDSEVDSAAGRRSAPTTGAMTEEEAYEILGLAPGADAEAISRAHRALMKRLHPDQGGTNWLAARINEAKDVLMRRHR